MDKNKKNIVFIMFVIVAVVLCAALIYSRYQAPKSDILLTTQPTEESESVDANKLCALAIERQKTYLNNDALATSETFTKYPVANVFKGPLADLDINSNSNAREFRTSIKEDLAKNGVNFAGHYTIVNVPMTGWGSNYFIVDRINGHVYVLPYRAAMLDFRKDSNLLIMNSKDFILDYWKETSPEAQCGYGPYKIPDLRPFYFLWKDNKPVLIGPKDLMPPKNDFFGAVQLTKEDVLNGYDLCGIQFQDGIVDIGYDEYAMLEEACPHANARIDLDHEGIVLADLDDDGQNEALAPARVVRASSGGALYVFKNIDGARVIDVVYFGKQNGKIISVDKDYVIVETEAVMGYPSEAQAYRFINNKLILQPEVYLN